MFQAIIFHLPLLHKVYPGDYFIDFTIKLIENRNKWKVSSELYLQIYCLQIVIIISTNLSIILVHSKGWLTYSYLFHFKQNI